MFAKKSVALVAAGLLAATLVSSCSYNKFAAKEQEIKAQWSQVENQLQRRNDLIPNLVETVKGYAAHETGVLQSIADARSKMAGAQTPSEKISAANAESSALSRLLVVVEAYPNLKADSQFARLMDEISNTENRLAVERMRYNDRVREYETMRHQFPSNLTAKVFSYKEYPYFEVPPEAKAVPKVDFNKK